MSQEKAQAEMLDIAKTCTSTADLVRRTEVTKLDEGVISIMEKHKINQKTFNFLLDLVCFKVFGPFGSNRTLNAPLFESR